MEIGTLLLQLGAVAALYAKVQSAVRQMAGKGEQREITNDPLRTQDSPALATLRDVERVEFRVVRLERELKDIGKENDVFREKMHDELREVRDRMGDQFQLLGETLRTIERSVGRLEGP